MRPTFPISNFKFNVNYIYKIFGEHVSATLKHWIDTNYRLIRATSQVHFLKNCKLNNLVPSHLSYIYRTMFYHNHYKTTLKLERLIYKSQRKILNIEIFDLHRYIYALKKNTISIF